MPEDIKQPEPEIIDEATMVTPVKGQVFPRVFKICLLRGPIPWENSGREEGNPAVSLRVSLWRWNPTSVSLVNLGLVVV